MSPTSHHPVRWSRRLLAGGLTAALAGGVMAATVSAPAVAAPPAGDEPGVTMRVYRVPAGLTSICTLKPATTPNVDKLMPNINWTTNAQFSSAQDPMSDNFIAHALANLTVDTAGSHEFELTSDDGSRLFIDGKQVINNDGLHGAEAKTGSITLTAGVHDLRVEFLEATGGQELTLRWKKPGQTAFTLVGNDVLSTKAGVTRVVAPGTKECEGAYDAPGDGLPLTSVNPAYDLVNLRDPSWQPDVTGLAWDGDDLLVLTWGGTGDPVNQTSEGELWRLADARTAETPADVTRTKLYGGMREPQGLALVDTNDDGVKEVWVSEKDGLIRLDNTDADPEFDSEFRLWEVPTSGNFHEFAFGLLHRDGKFWLNTSVSIDYGGATTNPQMAPTGPGGTQMRGNTLTIDDTTGAATIVAGGLRTPNGIGFGPEDGVFVTDNQGGWLPSSKLVHIKQGRFFEHRTNPAGPFQNEPVTKPVLWMPQNEIANSPSTPVLVPDGPFKGQLMIGDVTYGGLQRAFLEKVGGEYQGALFRGTQGLEAGINEVLMDDSGAVVVGGIGGGGNWEQSGKLTYGLQMLRPTGETAFEMKSMEVVEGGFKITYTEPVSAETLAELANKYEVEQWRYRATAAYGGPKLDQESLQVASATASADGTTVTLAIEGMKADRVVHLRSPRPFTSADGDSLWNTEAWYTLNSYPGYVEPEEPENTSGLYEAEDMDLAGTVGVQTEHGGYSGSGYVGGFPDVGDAISDTVTAARQGAYDLTIRYTNGPNPAANENKQVTLVVNGVEQKIVLPTTGTWQNYQTFRTTVTLNQGANTVALRKNEGDRGHVNIDYLQFVSQDGVRYEIEDGTLAGGANIQTEHAGFSGTGYVGGLETQNRGASATITVNASKAGEHPVTLGYANGPNPQANQTKKMTLEVNGVAQQIQLPPKATWKEWTTWTGTLALRAGANTVAIRFGPNDDGNVNLDYLDVKAPAPIVCDPVTEQDDTFEGDALDLCRWNLVLNEDTTGYRVAGGKLEINAKPGDLSSGNPDAKNVVLQAAQADNTWTAETTVAVDGTDDYIQSGIVAYGSNQNYGKLVVMNHPQEGWVVEVAKVTNGALAYSPIQKLPVGANKTGVRLKLTSDGFVLRGQYSLDGGTTWVNVGAQPAGSTYGLSGIATPRLGLAAYNGTGTEVATFDDFVVGEPVVAPDTCAPTPADAGYKVLYDGTSADLTDGWEMAGGGEMVHQSSNAPEGVRCSMLTSGGFGLLWHTDPIDYDYSLTLDWMKPGNGNSGIFVGFPDPQGGTQGPIDLGHEIQIDSTDADNKTTGAIYNFQGADKTARDAALKPDGQWNSYDIVVEGDRIRVYLNDVLINDFTDVDPRRMNKPSFIGLQTHGAAEDQVYFRNVQIKNLDDVDPEPVASTTTVTANPSSVEVGQTSTVTVDVAAAGTTPSGSVTLTDNGQPVGSAVALANGKATFQVGPYTAAGNRAFVATYEGSPTVAGSTGNGALTVTAAPDPEPVASTTTVTANPSSVEVGQASTVTVTVAAAGVTPSGSVTLTDNGQAVGTPATLVDGKATFPVGPYTAAGNRAFVATYAGSPTVAGSTGNGALTVTAAPDPGPVASTVTATATPAKVQVGSRVELAVTVSADGVTPTGQVVVRDGIWVIGTGTLVDGKVTVRTDPLLAVGNRTLAVSYDGDDAVEAGSASVKVVVQAKPKPKPSLTVKPAVVDAGKNRRFGAVKVTCQPAGVRCVGTVKLWNGGKVLGTAKYALSGGKSTTVQVTLTNRARTLLAKRPRVQGNLVVAVDGAGSKTVKVTLTR